MGIFDGVNDDDFKNINGGKNLKNFYEDDDYVDYRKYEKAYEKAKEIIENNNKIHGKLLDDDLINDELVDKIRDDMLKNTMTLDYKQFAGFILSYGVGDDLVPVASFAIAGYVSADGTPIDEYTAFMTDGFIVFKDVDFSEGREFSFGNKTITIPCREYKKLASMAIENDYELELLSGAIHSKDSNLLISDTLRSVSWEIFAEHPELKALADLKLEGSSLDDIQASYTNGDIQMGYNYTIYPFSNGKVKTIGPKEYIKTRDDDDRDGRGRAGMLTYPDYPKTIEKPEETELFPDRHYGSR